MSSVSKIQHSHPWWHSDLHPVKRINSCFPVVSTSCHETKNLPLFLFLVFCSTSIYNYRTDRQREREIVNTVEEVQLLLIRLLLSLIPTESAAAAASAVWLNAPRNLIQLENGNGKRHPTDSSSFTISTISACTCSQITRKDERLKVYFSSAPLLLL